MSTYLYCLTLATRATGLPVLQSPAVRGIDDGPIRFLTLTVEPTIAHAPMAWVGSVPATPTITTAHLSAHDRVATAAIEAGYDVLPARFAQTFATDEALEQDLLRRAPALTAVWRRIAGAVEMSLQIEMPVAAAVDGEASSAGTGYAYMERLARPVRQRRLLREQVEPIRRQIRQDAGATIREDAIRLQLAPSVATLSHLIDRHSVSEYRRLVDGVLGALTGVKVLVSGPYAPYSFVSLDSAGP